MRSIQKGTYEPNNNVTIHLQDDNLNTSAVLTGSQADVDIFQEILNKRMRLKSS
jgi:hypothetical protein